MALMAAPLIGGGGVSGSAAGAAAAAAASASVGGAAASPSGGNGASSGGHGVTGHGAGSPEFEAVEARLPDSIAGAVDAYPFVPQQQQQGLGTPPRDDMASVPSSSPSTPRSPSVQPPQPSWVFTTELLVPAHLIGRCVGRKGSTIRRVAEETGASLTIQCVDGRTHMPGMGDGKVVIRAEVAEVAMAAASLMRRVMTEGPP